MKVCIDAGHGGDIPGAVGRFNGAVYLEKDPALTIALGVEKHLKHCHITTVMTRSTDIALTLAKRVKIANDSKCDLFVSIHLNGHHTNAKGFEVYHHPSGAGKRAAQHVYDAFMKAFPHRKGRGVKTANFYVLRQNRPAILIEVGFITNQEEAEWIYANLDEIATVFGKAIEGL